MIRNLTVRMAPLACGLLLLATAIAACRDSRQPRGVELVEAHATLASISGVHSWTADLLAGVEVPGLLFEASFASTPAELTSGGARRLLACERLVVYGNATDSFLVGQERGLGDVVIRCTDEAESQAFSWLSPDEAEAAVAVIAKGLSAGRDAEERLRIEGNAENLVRRIAEAGAAAREGLAGMKPLRVATVDSRFEPFLSYLGIETVAALSSRPGVPATDAEIRAFGEAAAVGGAQALVACSDERLDDIAAISSRSGLRVVSLDPMRSGVSESGGGYVAAMQANVRNLALGLSSSASPLR